MADSSEGVPSVSTASLSSTLVFCDVCGSLQLKTVTKQLQILFDERSLKPGVCGICRTSVHPLQKLKRLFSEEGDGSFSEQQYKRSRIETITIDLRGEYEGDENGEIGKSSNQSKKAIPELVNPNTTTINKERQIDKVGVDAHTSDVTVLGSSNECQQIDGLGLDAHQNADESDEDKNQNILHVDAHSEHRESNECKQNVDQNVNANSNTEGHFSVVPKKRRRKQAMPMRNTLSTEACMKSEPSGWPQELPQQVQQNENKYNQVNNQSVNVHLNTKKNNKSQQIVRTGVDAQPNTAQSHQYQHELEQFVDVQVKTFKLKEHSNQSQKSKAYDHNACASSKIKSVNSILNTSNVDANRTNIAQNNSIWSTNDAQAEGTFVVDENGNQYLQYAVCGFDAQEKPCSQIQFQKVCQIQGSSTLSVASTGILSKPMNSFNNSQNLLNQYANTNGLVPSSNITNVQVEYNTNLNVQQSDSGCTYMTQQASTKKENRPNTLVKSSEYIPSNLFNFMMPSTDPLKPFKCKYCDVETFANVQLFQDHYRTHITKNPYRCIFCANNFATEDEFKKHKVELCTPCTEKDMEEITKCVDSRVVALMGMQARRQMPFHCKHCPTAEFKTAHRFLHHLRTKHPELYTDVDLDFLMKHGGYKCDVCDKSYRNPERMKKHYMLHTGERPFKCEHESCDKMFRTKGEKNHHTIQHGEKKLQCDTCRRYFWSKLDLKAHRKMAHLNTRPYQCQYCGSKWQTKHMMQNHINRVHLKLKPYICELCGKSYPCSNGLQIHKTCAHDRKKAFKCSYCDFAACLKNNLTIHLRQHTGERPYVCQHCGKDFVQRVSLKQHLKNHHSDRPIK